MTTEPQGRRWLCVPLIVITVWVGAAALVLAVARWAG